MRTPARAPNPIGRVPVATGRVRRGDSRGRQLGFPTANLARPRREVRDGVYAAWVGIDGEPPARPAVATVGASPTFGVRARRLEVHLLDFDGDLYGRRLGVAFRARLAGQRRCSSPAELSRRIRALVARTRRVLRLARSDLAVRRDGDGTRTRVGAEAGGKLR